MEEMIILGGGLAGLSDAHYLSGKILVLEADEKLEPITLV